MMECLESSLTLEIEPASNSNSAAYQQQYIDDGQVNQPL